MHLSAGDLLRAEKERAGSSYGELINRYIADGQIVPMVFGLVIVGNYCCVTSCSHESLEIQAVPYRWIPAQDGSSRQVRREDCPLPTRIIF